MATNTEDKKAKASKLLNNSETFQTTTQNRFETLVEEPLSTDQSDKTQPPKIPKPPPIFVQGVLDYNKKIQSINEVAESEQFLTKCLTNNVLKLNCETPDTYRTLVKHFK